MDPGFPSEQLSLPYNLPYDSSDAGQDYLAHQSRAEPFPTNLQSNGTEVSPRSHSFPHYSDGNWDEPVPGYWSTQLSVPSTLNNQSQLNPQPFHSNDPSHTLYQVLEPFSEGHPIGHDTYRVAHGEAHYAAGPSGPPISSLTMIAGTSSLLSGELSPPRQASSIRMDGEHNALLRVPRRSATPAGQDDSPQATLSPHERGEVAAESHRVTHGQNATTQASQQREQKAREKKEKDRVNKRGHRSRNAQDFERICALLEIPLKPKNRLAHRILEVVQGLVEQHEVDSDLRDQLKQKEAEVAYMKMKCLQD